MRTDLKDRVALVTGSSAGVGKAIAHKLAENGAFVYVNGRRQDRCDKVVYEISERGGVSATCVGNVTNYQECQAIIDQIRHKSGRLDILINNVGGAQVPELFLKIPVEQYIEIIRDYYLSALYMTRAAVELMIEGNYGKIVNIASDAARVGTPGEVVVGGAKAGMLVLAKSLAPEVARWNIRVNTLCISITPGTEMFELVQAGKFSHKLVEKAEQRVLFGFADPNDIREAVLYLVSPESDRMTGQIISLNGGLSFPG